MNIYYTHGVPIQPYVVVPLVNNTAKTVTVVVPEKTIWRLSAANILNGDNVARTMKITVLDAAGNIVGPLAFDNAHAAAGYILLPSASFPFNPIMLESYWQIQFFWDAGGASAGGNGSYGIYAEAFGKHEP
jgi:hypothetical protein